ncbi:MAG: hypothetical protein ACRC78_03030 [Planktothrix sp.]
MLTDREVLLLYEIYEVPLVPETILTGWGSGGLATPPFTLSTNTNAKRQLEIAIPLIQADEARVENIRLLLIEYETFRGDPSDIDKNGYSFRAVSSMKTILRSLFSYTGIMPIEINRSNMLPRG